MNGSAFCLGTTTDSPGTMGVSTSPAGRTRAGASRAGGSASLNDTLPPEADGTLLRRVSDFISWGTLLLWNKIGSKGIEGTDFVLITMFSFFLLTGSAPNSDTGFNRDDTRDVVGALLPSKGSCGTVCTVTSANGVFGLLMVISSPYGTSDGTMSLAFEPICFFTC